MPCPPWEDRVAAATLQPGIGLLNGGPSLAMSQGRHRVMQLLIASVLPPQLALHPDDLAAVGPSLLIRQAEAHLSRS